MDKSEAREDTRLGLYSPGKSWHAGEDAGRGVAFSWLGISLPALLFFSFRPRGLICEGRPPCPRRNLIRGLAARAAGALRPAR